MYECFDMWFVNKNIIKKQKTTTLQFILMSVDKEKVIRIWSSIENSLIRKKLCAHSETVSTPVKACRKPRVKKLNLLTLQSTLVMLDLFNGWSFDGLPMLQIDKPT